MAAMDRLRQLLDRFAGREDLGRVRVAPPVDTAGAGVRIAQGMEYRGGYDDPTVEDIAVEDGRGSVPDPSTWGENTRLYALGMFLSAFPGLRHLVGHAYRDGAIPLEQEIEATVPAALTAEQDALDAIEGEAEARRQGVDLGRRIKQAGLVPPDMADIRRYVLKLTALVVGDLTFIAVAFQVLGLSDRLLFGILPFSSELQIAALSSVLALLFLAHHAGENLVEISHHNRRRRNAGAEAEPRLGIGAYVAPGVWILGAVAVLVGIAAVREAYLVARGTPAYTWVFVAIQGGVFCAALALSMSHAHPFTRDWARVTKRIRAATAAAGSSIEVHARLVGRVNGLIDQWNAMLAMAGQHVRVGEADVARQIFAYLRRVQLSLPEPIHERLFPTEIPAPEEVSDERLRSELIGLTEIPAFRRLDVLRVIARRQRLREELELRRLGQEGGQLHIPFDLVRASDEGAGKNASSNGGTGS